MPKHVFRHEPGILWVPSKDSGTYYIKMEQFRWMTIESIGKIDETPVDEKICKMLKRVETIFTL